MPRRSFSIDDNLMDDIRKIAKENNLRTENAAVEEALKFYRDYMYMKDKSTIINEEILRVNKSGLDLLEQHINHKTNQVISSLSIQVCILTQIIANSLEVDPLQLPEYQRRALEFIKTNNRVFRLDELVE